MHKNTKRVVIAVTVLLMALGFILLQLDMNKRYIQTLSFIYLILMMLYLPGLIVLSILAMRRRNQQLRKAAEDLLRNLKKDANGNGKRTA